MTYFLQAVICTTQGLATDSGGFAEMRIHHVNGNNFCVPYLVLLWAIVIVQNPRVDGHSRDPWAHRLNCHER